MLRDAAVEGDGAVPDWRRTLPVGREPALALRPGRRHRQGHEHPVVVERRKVLAVQDRDTVADEAVVLQFNVASHFVELQHRRDPVGLLEPHVRHVAEGRGPSGEGAEHRQHWEPVGHSPAVDIGRLEVCAVVAHPEQAGRGVGSHRQAHACDYVDQLGLGVVDLGGRGGRQPAEQHVGRVERGDGQAEGRGSDIGGEGDRCWVGHLARC